MSSQEGESVFFFYVRTRILKNFAPNCALLQASYPERFYQYFSRVALLLQPGEGTVISGLPSLLQSLVLERIVCIT